MSVLSIIIPCKNEPDIVEMMVETERLFPHSQIVVSSDRHGQGKGWALRRGLEEANGQIICFIDGDLDIHPREILAMLPGLQDHDIVVGRKEIQGLWHRKVITACSRIFIGIVFGLWFDTQTGVKLFRRDYLPEWKNNSFAYDLEILYKAKEMGAKIIECPVNVNIRKAMPGRSITRFLHGALQIRWELLCGSIIFKK